MIGKVKELIFLETMLRHREDREVIRESENGFTNSKSCLTNLVAFCDQLKSSMDNRKAAPVIYPELCKTFNEV